MNPAAILDLLEQTRAPSVPFTVTRGWAERSGHALDRYREHHPNATTNDLWNAVQHGEPLDMGVVNAALQRHKQITRSPRHRHILTPDGWGIVVTVWNPPGRYDPHHLTEARCTALHRVVTYIRLSLLQRRILRPDLPLEAPPGAAHLAAEPSPAEKTAEAVTALQPAEPTKQEKRLMSLVGELRAELRRVQAERDALEKLLVEQASGRRP